MVRGTRTEEDEESRRKWKTEIITWNTGAQKPEFATELSIKPEHISKNDLAHVLFSNSHLTETQHNPQTCIYRHIPKHNVETDTI